MKRLASFAATFFSLWADAPRALDFGEADSFLVDLDGDQQSEMVTIQYENVSLVVNTDGNMQIIALGSTTEQLQEPCRKPANLTVVPLDCRVGAEQLEGCSQGISAKGLLLNAAGCGSVYLYWNGDTQRIDWRKL